MGRKRKGTKAKHGGSNHIMEQYTKPINKFYSKLSFSVSKSFYSKLSFSKQQVQTSCEIAGAIDLWLKAELSDFIKKQLTIKKFSGNNYIIRTNAKFNENCHIGNIFLLDNTIHLTCMSINIDKVVEYCDPKMFDEIEHFIMRIYNG